ncbi:MAG: type II secretion system F family protein [Pirellulales bacterium]|nr:type II secretion system F family protein [Pirellulales bacterium]
MLLPHSIAWFVAILLPVVLVAVGFFIFRHLDSAAYAPRRRNLLGWLLVFICMVSALVQFVLVGPYWGIVSCLLAFVIVDVVRRHWATRQRGLLWMLTVSAERSLPLGPAVEAFARERGGWHARHAWQLAAMLNAGAPLPEALERCPGLLPRYVVPPIRVGCETGALAQALRRAATVHDLNEPVWVALQGKIAYLIMVPVCGFMLLQLIMLFIVPSFVEIFCDFEIRLPRITQQLISVSDFIVDFWFMLLPFGLFGMVLLFYLPIRYFGWIDLDLPGMGRFTRRLDSAEILDALSFVAGQGQPISQGVATLARSYPKSHIRARLSRAATDISRGNDWCESLHRQDLIRRPELAILKAAQRVGNLSWAMSELADSARRRLAYRVQAIAQTLFPPMVILIGLAVLFVVTALFIPLISLISALA